MPRQITLQHITVTRCLVLHGSDTQSVACQLRPICYTIQSWQIHPLKQHHVTAYVLGGPCWPGGLCPA